MPREIVELCPEPERRGPPAGNDDEAWFARMQERIDVMLAQLAGLRADLAEMRAEAERG